MQGYTMDFEPGGLPQDHCINAASNTFRVIETMMIQKAQVGVKRA